VATYVQPSNDVAKSAAFARIIQYFAARDAIIALQRVNVSC
jgi:hypothetical protein